MGCTLFFCMTWAREPQASRGGYGFRDILFWCLQLFQGLENSSSQYSPEVQQIFLTWLPGEERLFVEASEGLGNSQKAEVAWLQREGNAYTELEMYRHFQVALVSDVFEFSD